MPQLPTPEQVLIANSSSAAAWATAPVAWINAVTTYGADPTGTNDSTTAIQSALDAVPAHGGVVYLPAGIYRVNSSIIKIVGDTQCIKIMGDGILATLINFHGTGDVFRLYNNTSYTNMSQLSRGSSIEGLGIDGTSAGAVDKYVLDATDGIHWYGTAFQNMS